MGFQDRIVEVGKGIGDLVTAPVGLLWDTARAITSDQYSPGFFGVFGGATEKAFTGLSRIGEATGIAAGIKTLGETGFGEGLKSFWDEMELMYSTEFQRQQRMAPWGLRPGDPLHNALGQPQPGDISLQRGVAGTLGTIGALKPGGVGAGDFQQVWRRAGEQSPGQSFYETILTDFAALPPSLQEQVKASGHYNLITGTVDAVARWFLSPDVLLGKGAKVARQQAFVLDSAKNLELAMRRLGRTGLTAKRAEDTAQGMRSITLGADEGQRVWAVQRSSGIEQMVDEGNFRVTQGMDEAIDLDESWSGSQSLEDRVTQLDDDAFLNELDEVREELGGEALGDPVGDVIQHYALKGLPKDNPAQALDDILSGVDQGSPEAMHALLDAVEAGGASPVVISHMAQHFSRSATSSALSRANDAASSRGIMGPRGVRVARPQRFIGSQSRPIVLFDNYEEAKRYASRLYDQDRTDVPVFLDIEANNLDALYEEFDQPIPDIGENGAFFTLAEKLEGQDVKIRRVDPGDLDPVERTAQTADPEDVERNLRIYN